jgi:hypothetical protein
MVWGANERVVCAPAHGKATYHELARRSWEISSQLLDTAITALFKPCQWQLGLIGVDVLLNNIVNPRVVKMTEAVQGTALSFSVRQVKDALQRLERCIQQYT